MKRESKPTFALIFFLIVTISGFLSAAEFSAKVVDRLGHPLPGATISVYWLKRVSDDKVDQIDLLKLTSGSDGKVKGSYRGRKKGGASNQDR